MAVETTALGFKKPDGKELINTVDELISDNAQVAQDILGQLVPDVDALKVLGGLAPGDVTDTTVAALLNDPNTETAIAITGIIPPVESDILGTTANPVTSATAARPVDVTSVWWATSTQPANWVDGDVWMVTP